MAYRAARIIALMRVHQVFCFLLRQLFCRDVSAMFANDDVAPVDQGCSIRLAVIRRLNLISYIERLFVNHEISLNDGDAPINLAILYFRKTACSLPQSLHRILTLPEMLLYFGFVVPSSAMHSITLPQSQENTCFGMDVGYCRFWFNNLSYSL